MDGTGDLDLPLPPKSLVFSVPNMPFPFRFESDDGDREGFGLRVGERKSRVRIYWLMGL